MLKTYTIAYYACRKIACACLQVCLQAFCRLKQNHYKAACVGAFCRLWQIAPRFFIFIATKSKTVQAANALHHPAGTPTATTTPTATQCPERLPQRQTLTPL